MKAVMISVPRVAAFGGAEPREDANDDPVNEDVV